MRLSLYMILIIFICSCKNDANRRDSKINSLPSFNILLADSSTVLNAKEIPKGNNIILMYFNTDCPHCKKITKGLLENNKSLKNVNIYLLTGMPLNDLKNYSKQFNIGSYKNFTAGVDFHNSFYKAFKPRAVPYIAIYDNKRMLKKIYSGGSSIQSIIETANN